VSEDAEVDVAALLDRLHRVAATVAVAESLTGGLLTAALTEVGGASAVVRGGLVVYATDLKSSLAGVPTMLLAERGAVDRDVALELARGARARLRATVGIGVTGVAGPDPQDGVAVGTVFLAVSGPGGETVAERQFQGDRAAVRRQAVAAALLLLERESLTLAER
jgi:nicotinamide-nucleotide amidase